VNKEPRLPPTHAERPPLLRVLAVIAYLGCAALIGGTFAAQLMVPDHEWMADTISDLAAGRLEIVMDVALYGFATGLFATALSASHVHLGGIGWSAGLLALAVIAALVVVVAARNEYGDGDDEGVVIHIYLVYGLGALFLLAPLGFSAGLEADHPRARRALIGLAILWGLSAPVFFFLPTSIDGLYERYLGLIAVAILLTLALVFHARARAAAR
jgi:hypothetical protein